MTQKEWSYLIRAKDDFTVTALQMCGDGHGATREIAAKAGETVIFSEYGVWIAGSNKLVALPYKEQA